MKELCRTLRYPHVLIENLLFNFSAEIFSLKNNERSRTELK